MSSDKCIQPLNCPLAPVKIWYISITQKAFLCSFVVIPPKPTTGRKQFDFYHHKLFLSILKVYNRMILYILSLCLTLSAQCNVNEFHSCYYTYR